MRTTEEFAKEMIARGKTRTETRSVALATRWSADVEEILRLYDRLAPPARMQAA